ncbi:Crp/Fnr family transcriptional regulator [Neorhizobium sp. T786]|uniref:Crp/Fnr family transcriptional regulator n=1 Tax=Pseudorhizobium xiangyangii TaxID=2883104 RepID=UPI001CFF5BEC|nr:Crp/Fnr family transcriptional regulator [Neorhizobium xiangyangii]MCB5205526.1 Crp/Fnr family transcriptional regulator [Neorhizobium xiangyangii]
MAHPKQATIQNKLLSLLPETTFDLVAPSLEAVVLPLKTVLATRGEPIEHVYFLTSGLGSVIVETAEGHRAEAGLFGFDGHIPTSAAADVELAPHEISMQLPGEGYRMSYSAFAALMDSDRGFSKVMIRCMEAFTIQLSYTAASNSIHDINERLARWLLMCHDRVQGNEIGLTHDAMAVMLAVRRPSVTTALHVLEGLGFIRSTRGRITIRDRAALEEFAQDAYGRPEAEYRRLMKGLPKSLDEALTPDGRTKGPFG